MIGTHQVHNTFETVSMVTKDLADKLGMTFAVVWKGDLLPVRFKTRDEANAHMYRLLGKAQGVS